MISNIFSSAQTQTTVEEVSFTYDGTDFTFFQTSPIINQPDAQTQCINWGGNLATINSGVEDSLLFHSIPDLETTFTCHIGLNDIDNEAGTDGDEFVWIDGSNSTYRKWGTLQIDFPIPTADYDCVRHRYRGGGELSYGWLNGLCSSERNCYFCGRSGKHYPIVRPVASNFKLVRPVHSATTVTTSLIICVRLFRNIVRFCDAASHSTELLANDR